MITIYNIEQNGKRLDTELSLFRFVKFKNGAGIYLVCILFATIVHVVNFFIDFEQYAIACSNTQHVDIRCTASWILIAPNLVSFHVLIWLCVVLINYSYYKTHDYPKTNQGGFLIKFQWILFYGITRESRTRTI